MKKVLKSLIPLGIAAGFFLGNSLFAYFIIRFVEVRDVILIGSNITITQVLFFKQLVFPAIIFCTSYLLTGLVIKDKKNIIWFVVLHIVISLIPVCLGMREITHVIYSIPNYIQHSIYAIFFYLGFNWLEKKKQLKELEKQHLQSELALLKNQINPHFLFNTLNNIDSLIKSNPDHASKSLLELSGIMRYMLYETNTQRVPLQKELDYIEDYLKLQKIQYANAQLVEYTVSGDPDNIEIAPMLFIPFIENAFKHCTDKEKAHAIQFSMEINDKQIRFKASNIADPNHPISKDSTNGIGLDTVKRRLAILYPDKHSLQISEKNNLFCVELNIDSDD